MPELPGFNMLSAGPGDRPHDRPVRGVASARTRCAPCRCTCAKAPTRWAPPSCRPRCASWCPAAFSGIAAAYILGISRAVGETMVVAIAAGMQPNLTFNPTEPAATITAYIVQVSLGDLPHGSIGYQSIFAAGLVLMLMTLVFNVIGFFLRPPLPGGVLMAAPRTDARGDPRGLIAWRKQLDKVFVGRSAWRCCSRCLALLAILFLDLRASTARRGFGWDFFTSVPVAPAPSSAGILSALGRHRRW
ncbi:MAG: hypothetical protein MZV65_53525 [Chromatiales bacterium]|nr:hypothetical protein [Chromatiales bacterium]